MKVDLKNPITQLENSKENTTSKMNQTEDRLSGLNNKVEDPDQMGEKYKKFLKTTRKEHRRNMGHYGKKKNLWIKGSWGRRILRSMT